MSSRFVAALVGLVLVVVAVAELLLDPPSADRTHLIVILAIPALVAALAVPLLRRWVSSRSSVAGAALAVGLISLGLGAAISSAASNAMFLSSHDYRLFLVVLLLSGGLALLVGHQLSRPLADDIRRLGHVATMVAEGDLSASTGITRRDEVGQTAAAVDAMVARLRDAEADRARLDEARRHLLTGVGHDLRTPLAAMRAAVEGLQDGVTSEPERYLAVVAAQLVVVEQMIDQLFAFARIEAAGPGAPRERVSLTELADDTTDALAPLAERAGVAVRVVADGPAVAEVSPADISRVLRNLVDNAVAHSPRGGAVSISLCEATDHVHITVTDDGPGFPQSFRERAFEPFTRADPARSATGSSGLGLAIARSLVEAHGGSIAIDDVPHGAVSFSLPVGTPAQSNEPVASNHLPKDT